MLGGERGVVSALRRAGVAVTGVVGGPGGDLLSHVLRRSTMGASGFHGRVRNGVGWGTRAIGHQVDAPPPWPQRGQAASRCSGPGWGRGVVGKSVRV